MKCQGNYVNTLFVSSDEQIHSSADDGLIISDTDKKIWCLFLGVFWCRLSYIK